MRGPELPELTGAEREAIKTLCDEIFDYFDDPQHVEYKIATTVSSVPETVLSDVMRQAQEVGWDAFRDGPSVVIRGRKSGAT